MKKLSFEKHQGPLRSRPARALIMKYHHTPAVGHKWWSREKILHLRKHFSNKCILGYTDICEVKYIPFRRTYCDKFTTEMMRLKLGKTTCWHDNSNNFRNVCKCVLWFCLQPSCFKMMFFSVYSTHCAHLCDSIVTERSMLKKWLHLSCALIYLPAVQSFPQFPPHWLRWLPAWAIWRISLSACQHLTAMINSTHTHHIRCQKLCVDVRLDLSIITSSLT